MERKKKQECHPPEYDTFIFKYFQGLHKETTQHNPILPAFNPKLSGKCWEQIIDFT